MSGQRGANAELRKIKAQIQAELEKKEKRIMIDTVIDIVGISSPFLKSVLNVGADYVFDSSKAGNGANLTKEAIKKKFPGNEGLNNLASGTSSVISAISKFIVTFDDYKKRMEKAQDVMKILDFYSFNSGAQKVGLYDYDVIRMVQEWNNKGMACLCDVHCYLELENIYR
ncbi:hypothetical protein [Butyrivibrio proteoclasticus]|uniref:hypothetical protein n=1 Tax=Butyrivibrio proteoclasticus TaxID=43305 RepID=UPI0004798DFD|nr:hypothetical protein [Butyrivibrio proteoclasticus]